MMVSGRCDRAVRDLPSLLHSADDCAFASKTLMHFLPRAFNTTTAFQTRATVKVFLQALIKTPFW